MPRAVTNRYFPMLAHTLRDLFGIELDYDPALEVHAGQSFWRLRTLFSRDPEGRIRILFVDGTEDLSSGWLKDRDVIGNSFYSHQLALVAEPEEFDFTSEGCRHVPRSKEGYLMAVTLHELYEVLTGDTRHCDHPGRCVNSECPVTYGGYCCLCMGGLIDEKWPDLTLEDLYCEEDLAELRQAL